MPLPEKGKLQLYVVLAFVLGAIFLAKMLRLPYAPPAQSQVAAPMPVQARMLAPQTYRLDFQATGVVQAKGLVEIVPEVSGRVIAVHEDFFSGGHFEPENVVFEIEPGDLRLEVDQKRSSVEEARTALTLQEAESAAALAGWTMMHGSKQVPTLVAREPQIAQAKAALQSAEIELAQAELDLAHTRYRFPFSGKVIRSDIAPGKYVNAGQAYGVVFDPKALQVQAALEGRQLQWLLQAQDPSITFKAHALGQRLVYPGHWEGGASSVDSTTRLAEVYFEFGSPVQTLLPGTFTEVYVEGPELQNVMLLPLEAKQPDGRIWQVKDGMLSRWEPEVIYETETYHIVEAAQEPIEVVISRLIGAGENMPVQVMSGAEG